jgi:hypothetical protein
MVFSYGMALVANSVNQGELDVQILYKASDPLTGREGIELVERELEQEEPLNVALWGRVQGQRLFFEEFNRETKVDLIVVSGDSSLLFPSGSSLGREDVNGILLSRDVAHRLFGNTQATDVPILYDGQEYILRGILHDAENTAVIQVSRGTGRVIDAAVIEIPEDRGQSTVIREFESRFWVVEGVFDLSLLGTLGNIFTIMLPLIVGGVLVFKGVKKGLSYSRTPIKCLVWLGMLLLILASYLWLNQGLPRVRLGFSPTMWSDFGYWRSYFGGIADTIGRMLRGEWGELERVAITNTWLQVQYGLLATGIFVAFIRKFRLESLWQLLIYCSTSFVATFLVIINTGTGDFLGVWSLWGLVSFYLIAKWIIDSNLLDLGADKIH